MKALAIESDRRHQEEKPVFEITAEEDGAGYVPAHANLEIKLVGPESLNQVTVTILDDVGQDHRAHGLPEGLTQEQADVFVWGHPLLSRGFAPFQRT